MNKKILISILLITILLSPMVVAEEVDNMNCGNSIIDAELGEECDDGELNGVIPEVEYGLSTTYCNALCINITLQGPYCGDETCDSEESINSCNGDCASPPEGNPSENTNRSDNNNTNNNSNENNNQQPPQQGTATKIVDEKINLTKQVMFEITKIVNNEEMKKEYTIILQERMYTENVNNNYVTILIQPNQKEIQLFEGQQQAIDINNDNIPDIIATVKNINVIETEIIIYKIDNEYIAEGDVSTDADKLITTNFYILVISVIIITVIVAVFYNSLKKKHGKQKTIKTTTTTNDTKADESIRVELMDYVAKAIESNLTDKEITSNLIKAGWNENEIRKAINNIRTL